MAVAIEVTMDGASLIRLDRRLGEVADNVADLEAAGAWADVSVILSEGLEELFDGQGRFGAARRWSRLQPTTVKQRQRNRFTPIRIGWQTGRMAQSLIEPTHPDAVEVMTPDTYIRGTAVQNDGVSYPRVFAQGRGRIQPARSIFRRLFGDRAFVDRILSAIGRRIIGEDDGE